MNGTSAFRQALRRLRTAPSFREGLSWVARAALKRARGLRPAFLTRRVVKRQKTDFWQDPSAFEYFVTHNEPVSAKNPVATYVTAVINERFLAYCPPGARVLDVGCGNGFVSIFLAQHGRAVTACDVSEPMLRLLAKNSAGLNIRIQRGDAYQMPFAHEEFDVVVARMFLYQFPDWTVVLREMARCCRRGGRLLIHFTSKENASLAAAWSSEACDYGELDDVRQIRPGHEQAFIGAFDARAVEKACHRAGLRVLERIPCTFFHYNRLIGQSLGTKRFDEFRQELGERLKDPKVLDFALWFERTAVQHMPVFASYYNVLVLEKI